MGYGPVPVKARGLSYCDFEEYPPWWLERHSDEEIAEPARAFGVDDASASNVAA